MGIGAILLMAHMLLRIVAFFGVLMMASPAAYEEAKAMFMKSRRWRRCLRRAVVAIRRRVAAILRRWRLSSARWRLSAAGWRWLSAAGRWRLSARGAVANEAARSWQVGERSPLCRTGWRVFSALPAAGRTSTRS